jgi:opacity protein-like surface antigen
MFKKVILVNAMLAMTTSIAFANGASFVPPPPHCVGSFYVGIGISRDVAKFNSRGTSSVSDETNTLGIDPITMESTLTPENLLSKFRRNVDIYGSGIDGDIFAGYSMIFNDEFTLAGEIFGNISSAKGNFHVTSLPSLIPILTPGITLLPNFSFGPGVLVAGAPAIINATVKARLDDTIGISIAPGFKIAHSTNFYGRVGLVYSRFKFEDSGTIQLVNSSLPQSGIINFNGFGSSTAGVLAGFPFNQNKYRTGVQVGIGLETMLTQKVGLRGEYDWERYGEINFRNRHSGAFTTNAFDTFDLPTMTSHNFTNVAGVSIKPTIDKFKLALIYHFS